MTQKFSIAGLLLERPEFRRLIDRLAEAQSGAEFAAQRHLAEDIADAAARSAKLRKNRRRNRVRRSS